MNTVNNNSKSVNNSVVMMAFSKGKETKESTGFSRYIGVAPVTVLAVNPTKEELEKIYGTTLNFEPEYIRKTDNGVDQAQIDFIVKTVADKCNGIDAIFKVTFYVTYEKRVGSNSGKIQVIDEFGRTAWATEEDVKNHTIPMYANGPANVTANYRPVYNGEEPLTEFIKTYLGIPSVMTYVNGSWEMKENTDDCEARLENIADYFKGNFSELKGVIGLQPTNKIKVLVGVKHGENGDTQKVFTDKFMKGGASSYEGFEKTLKERKDAGAYSNVDFEVCELKEYVVNSTNFNDPVSTTTAPTTCPW